MIKLRQDTADLLRQVNQVNKSEASPKRETTFLIPKGLLFRLLLCLTCFSYGT